MTGSLAIDHNGRYGPRCDHHQNRHRDRENLTTCLLRHTYPHAVTGGRLILSPSLDDRNRGPCSTWSLRIFLSPNHGTPGSQRLHREAPEQSEGLQSSSNDSSLDQQPCPLGEPPLFPTALPTAVTNTSASTGFVRISSAPTAFAAASPASAFPEMATIGSLG